MRKHKKAFNLKHPCKLYQIRLFYTRSFNGHLFLANRQAIILYQTHTKTLTSDIISIRVCLLDNSLHDELLILFFDIISVTSAWVTHGTTFEFMFISNINQEELYVHILGRENTTLTFDGPYTSLPIQTIIGSTEIVTYKLHTTFSYVFRSPSSDIQQPLFSFILECRKHSLIHSIFLHILSVLSYYNIRERVERGAANQITDLLFMDPLNVCLIIVKHRTWLEQIWLYTTNRISDKTCVGQ